MTHLCNFEAVVENGKERKIGKDARAIFDDFVRAVLPVKVMNLAGELVAINDEQRDVRTVAGKDFFGWMSSHYVHPIWLTQPGALTKSEFHSYLLATLPKISAVRHLPHEPMVPNIHYFTQKDCGATYSGALDELASFWATATPEDHVLIKAAFTTIFWGGRPGSRPAFVIESDGKDSGRGVGKSELLYAMRAVAGGSIECSMNERMESIKTRLLTNTVMSLVSFDNCKESRLSSGDLEGLITSPIISGRKMYVGNAEIDNYLIYVFTMNDASLSSDMASRAVRILLSRAPMTGHWQKRLYRFLEEKKQEIISDCIHVLKKAECDSAEFLRFTLWQTAVLSKFGGGDELIRLLKKRQGEVDADAEAASELEGMILLTIASHRGKDMFGVRDLNPYNDCVLIPRAILCDWLRRRMNKHIADAVITRMVRRAKIPHLTDGYKLGGVRMWKWDMQPDERKRLGAWRVTSGAESVLAAWSEFRNDENDEEQKQASVSRIAPYVFSSK